MVVIIINNYRCPCFPIHFSIGKLAALVPLGNFFHRLRNFTPPSLSFVNMTGMGRHCSECDGLIQFVPAVPTAPNYRKKPVISLFKKLFKFSVVARYNKRTRSAEEKVRARVCMFPSAFLIPTFPITFSDSLH